MKMTANCGIQKFRCREKIKHLSKYWGGRQHRTTPAGQILGCRDPCNPCGVDAYGEGQLSPGAAAEAVQKIAIPKKIL